MSETERIRAPSAPSTKLLAITVLARSPHLGHVLTAVSLKLTSLSENPVSE